MFWTDAPLFCNLVEYAKRRRVSFCMPGHKGGKGITGKFKKNLLQYDVTELPDTESLHAPKYAMQSAKQEAAEFFGCLDTFFLVNGSTGGIFAMIAATCAPGDTLIVNRACHSSVIHACAILGVTPIFIHQQIIDTFSIPEAVNQKTLIEVLDRNHSAKAVLITSPSYYGICSDIETIAKITRARGIPLLVDEAHGAQFAVNESIFPKTALEQGADLVVQSAHKTLNALNQASYLHFNSEIVNKGRLQEALMMLQTSSPSYLIAASADLARAELVSNGAHKWDAVYEQCERFRDRLMVKTNIQFISKLFNGKYNIANVDETRIVMNFALYDITGFDVAELLRKKYSIDVEMADLFNVVCIATPSNTRLDFLRLEHAVAAICKTLSESEAEPVFPAPPIPEMRKTPQAAFYTNGRYVRLDEAVGCVSRSTVVAYPPAVPIICTGELVTPESVGYIEALKQIGAEIVGLNENGFISIVEG